MQGRPHLGDFLIFASRVDAIGKQDHKKLTVGVNPNRSSGIAGVAETMSGEKMTAGGVFGWNSPAKGSRSIRELLKRGELRNGRAAQNAMMSVNSAV